LQKLSEIHFNKLMINSVRISLSNVTIMQINALHRTQPMRWTKAAIGCIRIGMSTVSLTSQYKEEKGVPAYCRHGLSFLD